MSGDQGARGRRDTIEVVCLDAAGTLIHVRGSVGQQYAAVAHRFGVDVDPAARDAGFPAAFRAAPPMAFPGARPDAVPALERGLWRDLVRGLVERAGCARALDAVGFEAYFDALYAHFGTPAAWEVFADVRPALEAIRARPCRTALVSNFDGRIVPLLRGLGLAAAFDAVVLSSRVGTVKPDPRIFEAALRALGVPARSVLHVGDSPREDEAGARAAGLHAVLLDRDGRHPGVSPDARITSLLELLPRLDGRA